MFSTSHVTQQTIWTYFRSTQIRVWFVSWKVRPRLEICQVFELIQLIDRLLGFIHINRYTSDSDYTFWLEHLYWTCLQNIFITNLLLYQVKPCIDFFVDVCNKALGKSTKYIKADFHKVRPFFIKGTKNHLNRSCWKKQFKNTTNTYWYSLCINTPSPQKNSGKTTLFRFFFFFSFRGMGASIHRLHAYK